VNNQSYEKVKYVHAYVDIYLTKKGEEEKKKEENLLLVLSSQKKRRKKKMSTRISIRKSVCTLTKGNRQQQEVLERYEPTARRKINK
jgi:hypothetical protein